MALGHKFVVSDIGTKFVVVDRHLWEQDNPQALMSVVGRSLLHSVHLSREDADQVCAEENAKLATKALETSA